jgi:hypothetical protein
MLVGCTHKGDVYDPHEALVTMEKRYAGIRDGQAKTTQYNAHKK